MANEQPTLSNAEIRNHIEYSLKILVSIFDEKLQNLESNISNLNSKIEMLTQRVDFIERIATMNNQTNSNFAPIKQEPTNSKKPEKESSSSLSDALRLIEDN